MARCPDVGKQRRWLDLMRRWQRSPLTIREFCQRNEVSEARFFAWRRVLRRRGLLDEPSSSKAASPSPAFVELSTQDTHQRGNAIDVVLKHRRCLRVRPGFDADLLLELVRLLEGKSC